MKGGSSGVQGGAEMGVRVLLRAGLLNQIVYMIDARLASSSAVVS